MPGEVIPPAAHSLRSETILIVEDDADIGEFLQQLIEEDDYACAGILSRKTVKLTFVTSGYYCRA